MENTVPNFMLIDYCKLSCKSEKRWANAIETTISDHKRDNMVVKFADENKSFLVLQAWFKINLLRSRREIKSRGAPMRFEFKSCRFDERFFAMLRNMWPQEFQLSFSGDCQLSLKERANFQEIAKCFNEFGQVRAGLHLNGFPDSSTDYVVHIELIPRKSPSSAQHVRNLFEYQASRIQASCLGDEEQEKENFSFPFVRITQTPEIVDSPIFMLACSLRNITEVDICCAKPESSIQVFDKLCSRPTYALPCKFEFYKHNLDWSKAILYVLDNFDKARIFNLEIPIFFRSRRHLRAVTTRVQNLVVHSKYLSEIKLYLVSQSQVDMCPHFLNELKRVISIRKRRDLCIKVRKRIIGTISRQKADAIVEASRSLNSIMRLGEKKEFRAVLAMLSAVTLKRSSSQRSSSTSPLGRMLSVDLLRYLHKFLL